LSPILYITRNFGISASEFGESLVKCCFLSDPAEKIPCHQGAGRDHISKHWCYIHRMKEVEQIYPFSVHQGSLQFTIKANLKFKTILLQHIIFYTDCNLTGNHNSNVLKYLRMVGQCRNM